MEPYPHSPTAQPSASADDHFDLNLPSPDSPLQPSTTTPISWLEFMEETAVRTRLYLERFDDREERPRNQNSVEFIWH
jgi:hypothetical protein